MAAPAVAYHEAGHAVFAWLFKAKLVSVWIVPASTRGKTEFDNEPTDPRELALISIAGVIAQRDRTPTKSPLALTRIAESLMITPPH